MVLICLPKVSAFWNFSFSRFCFRNAVSLNHTYLILPVSLSCHFATYIFFGSQTISFQSPAGLSTKRLPFSSLGKLRVISFWLGPSFHFPRCGWSPRPAKRQDGSAV